MKHRWMTRYLTGRCGYDTLGITLSALYMTICVVATAWDNRILAGAAPAILVYTVFRFCSRNLSARQAENRAFVTFFTQRRDSVRQWRIRRQDTLHRYCKCPGCHVRLRVPRGLGKLEITCPKCGVKQIKTM